MIMMGGGIPLMQVPMMQFRPHGVNLPVADGHFGFDPWEDLHHNMVRVVKVHGQQPPPQAARVHFAGAMPPPPILDAILGGMLGPPQGGGGPPQGGMPVSLGQQLNGLLGVFGQDHAGQFGRAQGSFHVEDDHVSKIRITASLPGYRLGQAVGASTDPLSVQVLGDRSVVVSGTQQMGPHMRRTWQRSFALPRGCDMNKVSVTYNASSGDFAVDIPRTNSTAALPAPNGAMPVGHAEDDPDDEQLPPALRALKMAMPELLGQLNRMEEDLFNEMRQQQSASGTGFLKPDDAGAKRTGGDGAEQHKEGVIDFLHKLHPRNHPPLEVVPPVPEDATVGLVGCYAEAQLANGKLKYYGGGNAANFASMYWHAKNDGATYFAMARHHANVGHAFTFRSFPGNTKRHPPPRWGIYDGCGTHCDDESNRWCGCAHSPELGLPSGNCMPADADRDGQLRFAVYKIMAESPLADEEQPPDGAADSADGTADGTASAADGVKSDPPKATADAAAATEGPTNKAAADEADDDVEEVQELGKDGGHTVHRPHWQLSTATGEGGSAPAIEILVPKGTVATPKGREVLFFNAPQATPDSDKAGAATDAAASAPPPTGAPSATGASAPPDAQQAEPRSLEAVEQSTAAPVEGAAAQDAQPDADTAAPVQPAEEGSSASGAAGAPPADDAVPVSKVRLPAGVDADTCSWDMQRTNADGQQVIACQLGESAVKTVPIQVIGEEL